MKGVQNSSHIFGEILSKIALATHRDVETGELVHVDNAVFVLVAGEWVEESESKVRKLEVIGNGKI